MTEETGAVPAGQIIEPSTRKAPFAEALVDLGRVRPDVVVLSADVAKWTDVRPFAQTFPDRFIQMGMAEQNMMGVAGGLAKSGLFPIAVTYGVFASRRAYDQIAMALTTAPTAALVVGFLPGITSPFRATHQAIDDVALMRAMPGTFVLDPGDAGELMACLGAAVAYAQEHGRLGYLRGLRGVVADVLDTPSDGFEIGPPRRLLSGGDVGLISSGLGTQWALVGARELARQGYEPSLLHVPTLKPAADAAIVEYCSAFTRVVTVENHSIIGGLGAIVAAALAEAGCGTRLKMVGVRDRWPVSGSLARIRAAEQLDTEAIVAAAIGRTDA